MLLHKKNKKIKIKIVICENYIIPKASPAPNGSIEEKLKSLGKCPNTPPRKKIQYQRKSDESTLILDFNKLKLKKT